jgi:predicted dehydrogenase
MALDGLRVAIVGAGLMGRWHAQAAQQAGGRITAIVDPDAARRAGLAARFPGCRPSENLVAALEHADVVHLCTPAETHVEMAARILDHGRHALVEKPLAPSAADTAMLLDAARAHGVLLCPVYQFGFQDGAMAALAHLRSDDGALRHVDITMCSAGAEHTDGVGRARIANEVLPHPVSLLQRWLDADVSQLEWIVERPLPGEIRALTRAGAVTVTILISMSGRPTINRAVLIGSTATVEVDLFHGYAIRHPGRVSRGQKIAQPFLRAARLAAGAGFNLARRAWRRQPAYPGLRELVEQFYRSIRTGGAPPITPEQTLGTARALERLQRSNGSGGA